MRKRAYIARWHVGVVNAAKDFSIEMQCPCRHSIPLALLAIRVEMSASSHDGTKVAAVLKGSSRLLSLRTFK